MPEADRPTERHTYHLEDRQDRRREREIGRQANTDKATATTDGQTQTGR